ncbi:histone H2b, partial [Lactarius hatsudake]
LTQVHTSISNKTMAILKAILNSFVNDIFERFILSTSVTVTHSHHQNPDCCLEIQTVAHLIPPGELLKHAISEGTR